MDVIRLADGVPAQVGMTVYVLSENTIVERMVLDINGLYLSYKDPSYQGCRAGYAYSTREAAEAGYRKECLL